MKLRATTRQLYIMSYAGRMLIRGSARGSFWISRPHAFYRNQAFRNPSRKEIEALLDAGWVRLITDPHHISTTEDGTVTRGNRVVLTKQGREILKGRK